MPPRGRSVTIGSPSTRWLLTDQVPRIGKLAKLHELDNISHRMVVGMLAARGKELAMRDPEMATFVLVSAIESIVHRAALSRDAGRPAARR
ncbi:hypothetical protein BH11MYX1_BH11MYX1_44700 [soil metagenome]